MAPWPCQGCSSQPRRTPCPCAGRCARQQPSDGGGWGSHQSRFALTFAPRSSRSSNLGTACSAFCKRPAMPRVRDSDAGTRLWRRRSPMPCQGTTRLVATLRQGPVRRSCGSRQAQPPTGSAPGARQHRWVCDHCRAGVLGSIPQSPAHPQVLINPYWAFVLIMLPRVSCRHETPVWGFGASHPSVKVIEVFCQRQETVKDAASRSSGAGMGVPLREGSRDCPRSPRAGL